MNLKAIGGYFDQQYISVRDDLKPGEIFRVPILPKIAIKDFSHLDVPPQSIEIKHEDYIMEAIHSQNRQYWFLRLASIPIDGILMRVFG